MAADAGGPDREPIYLTREQATRVHGISPPTLDRLIADGGDHFVVEYGSNGRPYKIDAEKLQRYLEGKATEKAEADRKQTERINQLAMEFAGGEDRSQGSNASGLTIDQRIKLLNEEVLSIKVHQQRGELMEVSAVQRAYENRMELVNKFLRSMPDMLSKRLAWDASTTAACADAVESAQELFAKAMMGNVRDG